MYDQAGRVVAQGPQGLSKAYSDAINTGLATSDTIGKEYRLSQYDSNGRLLRQQAFETDEHNQQKMTSDTRYTAYDKAGNVVSYTMTVPGEYTNTYTYERSKFDGYKEKSLHATSTKFEEGQTDSFYDVNGNLVRIDDQRKDQNDRTLVNDLSGHALYVKQGTAIRRQVVVNGEVLGRYGIGVDEKNPRDKDGNPNFVVIADFPSGYQPVTGNYPSASVGSYQVQAGDTLRSIARQSYGDEGLWYRIAETNGLGGDRDLRVGQTITIPSAVGTIRNNTGTFTPYDASKITGDTMPHMPTPHSGGGGCGGIGMILVIVVAVIATVFTAGAAAIAMGAVQGATLATAGFTTIMSAGATVLTGVAVGGTALVAGSGAAVFGAAVVGAAVGSIASQGAAMAIGLQDKFSWKQVGMSALGGAVSAAIPSAAFTNFPGGVTAGLVVRSAVNNAITQGIGVAVGMQDKFNWRGVAASAAATFASESLKGTVMGTERFGDAGESLGRSGGLVGAMGGDTAARIAGSTIVGVAAGTVAAVARGGKFSIQQIAVDAFGNALAESLVEGMLPPTVAQQMSKTKGAIEAIEDLSNKYGGVDYIPTAELKNFIAQGRSNGETIRLAINSKFTDLGNASGFVGSVGNSAITSSSSESTSFELADASGPLADVPVVLPRVEISEQSNPLYTAAKWTSVAAGVIAGEFQNIGDGLIGLGSLVKDGLLAQQYIMGGGDNVLNRTFNPLFDAQQQAFNNVVGTARAVAELVQHPIDFASQALERSFAEVQGALDTANQSKNFGDWFLYGAAVGNATMGIASAIGGAAGAAKLAGKLGSIAASAGERGLLKVLSNTDFGGAPRGPGGVVTRAGYQPPVNPKKVFISKDPIVGELATALEHELPGTVSRVENPIKSKLHSSDADVQLKSGDIIEVKSGPGTGLETQVANQREIVGPNREVIVYGPELGGTLVTKLTNKGYNVFTNFHELLDYLKTK